MGIVHVNTQPISGYTYVQILENIANIQNVGIVPQISDPMHARAHVMGEQLQFADYKLFHWI